MDWNNNDDEEEEDKEEDGVDAVTYVKYTVCQALFQVFTYKTLISITLKVCVVIISINSDFLKRCIINNSIKIQIIRTFLNDKNSANLPQGNPLQIHKLELSDERCFYYFQKIINIAKITSNIQLNFYFGGGEGTLSIHT